MGREAWPWLLPCFMLGSWKHLGSDRRGSLDVGCPVCTCLSSCNLSSPFVVTRWGLNPVPSSLPLPRANVVQGLSLMPHHMNHVSPAVVLPASVIGAFHCARDTACTGPAKTGSSGAALSGCTSSCRSGTCGRSGAALGRQTCP